MPKGVPAAGFRKRGPNKNKLTKIIKSGRPDQTALNKMLHVDAHEVEIVVETDAQIREKLNDRFEILSAMTNAAISGDVRSLIVSGPAGLGKSYTVEKALEKWDVDQHNHTIFKGYLRAIGLYRLLYQHRMAGQVLVFDDSDSVFADETAVNILKAACDTTERRIIHYKTETVLVDEETAEILPKSFQFDGTIIFITNQDFDLMIERGSKLSPHFEALVSRSHYIDLAMKTRQDYLVRIRQVVYEHGLLKADGLDAAAEADVMKFIEDNHSKLRELSLRIAKKIGTLRRINPKAWMKIARTTCCRAA